MSESQEKDIVLKQGEYCFLLDKSKGVVQTLTGSTKLSMSQTDSLCVFSEKEKRFIETSPKEAIKQFVTAPENFYVILYNPVKGNPHEHPKIGVSNITPELDVGRKVIIKGNESFALFPGQFAKIIKGHSIKSNQYLMVRVYDAGATGDKKHFNGENIIIKGTDTPFYMPTTGYEVVPDDNGNYVRNATTLQDLQYSILVSESGEKRYVRGPAVVFPEVTEQFVINKENGTNIFRAIELSSISGIYVKVIADYCEEPQITGYINVDDEDAEDGFRTEPVYTEPIHHTAGEELFITGNVQKIYYPRPEHSIISYGDKIIHHAIAIPKGEGRYVLNRLTGEIRIIYGEQMVLLDPRYDVGVKRKLSKKECELWYPGNKEVLKYNCPEETQTATLDNLEAPKLNPGLTITSSGYMFSSDISSNISSSTIALDNGFYGQGNVVTDKTSGFSRGNTYTKPRTITIDNKYDGVVTIDVWTGYAVNVVGKDGSRKTIVGPQTYLLEYDETLECLNGEVYIRVENAVAIDSVRAQTKDYVDVTVNVSYCYSFDPAQKSKWFSIDNYKERLISAAASLIKQKVKKYTIEDFIDNASEIVKEAVLSKVPILDTEDTTEDKDFGLSSFENGMYVTAVDVLSTRIDNNVVRDLLNKHQQDMVSKALELSAASKEMTVSTELARLEKEKADLKYNNAMYRIEQESKVRLEGQKKKDEYDRLVEASQKAAQEAEKAKEAMTAAIEKIVVQAGKEKATVEIGLAKERDKLRTEREKAQTDAIEKVIKAISPDLIAALQTSSQNDMIRGIAENLSPYALAGGSESAADVVNKLLRGTGLGLDKLIDKVVETKE